MSQFKKVFKPFITPNFRVSWPAVFEAKPDPNGRLKYGVTMLFPKTTDLGGLKQAILAAAKEAFGEGVDMAALKLPKFRDGDKPTDTGKMLDGASGCWVLKASSSERPDVVDQKRQPMVSKDDFYAGCWARAQITIGAYSHPVGGRGIGLYLNNVQKVKDDTQFSGRQRAVDVFDEVAATTNSV